LQQEVEDSNVNLLREFDILVAEFRKRLVAGKNLDIPA
jgi:hypothetical protein